MSTSFRISAGVAAMTLLSGMGLTGQALLAVATAPNSSSRTNFVLIVTDDQRWDTLLAMPNVRRLLGGHGVMFDQAFVTTPLCCPSRAGILTGRYSHRTGVWQNIPPQGGAPAFDDRETLAVWLHRAGYETALIGKYLNAYELLPKGYVPPGWDRWRAFVSPAPYQRYTLNRDGHLVGYGSMVSTYSTHVLAREATRFVRRAHRPFFLYIAPTAPHLPSRPWPADVGALSPVGRGSPGETDRSDKPWLGQVPPLVAPSGLETTRRRMLESLIDVDRLVGKVVETLRDGGDLDRTVIAFTSDNGYLLGEHGLVEKAWPYEEAIRVPFVVRVPWIRAPGRTDHHQVLNVDLAPTFAELAGAGPPSSSDGRSLVPLLRGQREVRWRRAFALEYLGRPMLGGPPPYRALRTQGWLYVEYRNGWRELYDLTADPREMENLAEVERLNGLRVGLAERLHRTPG